MNRELFAWYSPVLNKEMPIVSYGHFGSVLLLVPTAAADYLEYERFLLIDALAPLLMPVLLKYIQLIVSTMKAG